MVLSALSPLRGECYHGQLQLRGTPVQKTSFLAFSDPVGLVTKTARWETATSGNAMANSGGRSWGMLDPFSVADGLTRWPEENPQCL